MLALYLMALLFTSQADHAVHRVPRGVSTGHVLLTARSQTFEGTTHRPEDTVIRLDGTFNSGFRATQDRGGYTLRNLTLDMAGLSTIGAAIEVNMHTPVVTVENVRVIDHYRGTLAVDQRGTFRAQGFESIGRGGTILQRPGAVSTTVRGMRVIGGQYAFQHTTSGRGIDLHGVNARHDYFALPHYEAVTATGYGATHADVESHVVDDRTVGDAVRHLALVLEYDAERTLRSPLVQLRDRIEVDGVAWTQILGGGPGAWLLDDWRAWGSWIPTGQPSGTARVLRASYGYLMGWRATRLLLQLAGVQPRVPRWRRWNGETAPTPSLSPGSRLDIIRHGKVNRDTDSGSIHCNENAVNARVVGCSIFGGGSDMITMRGVSSVVERSYVSTGYDMGFTIDGTDGRVTVRRCHADRAGRAGFHCSGGPSDLYSCLATNNGTINDGSGDYGVTCTPACEGSTLQVRGSGNLDGLLGGHITEVTPGGFESPRRAVRRRDWWRR